MDVSVVHALPGRLRIHVPAALLPQDANALVGDLPGVQSVRASAWTGNVLICYDKARTDAQSIVRALQRIRVGTVQRPHLGTPADVVDGQWPDPMRVVLPVLHIVYSCTPLGAGLHVVELGVAVARSAGTVRIATPVLHLALSCHPLGMVLHVGEMIWALTPFLVRSRPRASFVLAAQH